MKARPKAHPKPKPRKPAPASQTVLSHARKWEVSSSVCNLATGEGRTLLRVTTLEDRLAAVEARLAAVEAMLPKATISVTTGY